MNEKLDFSWLLRPFHVTDFFQNYLERKPLVIRRGDTRYFQDILTLDDIDFIVSRMHALGSYDVRMAAADKVIFEKQYASMSRVQNVEVKSHLNTAKVLELFTKHGATIIIEQISNVWPSIARLSDAVNESMSCSSGANIYISPAESQGFEAHYDTHDVFILQVHGSKRWKIYENPVYLPLGSQPSIPYSGEQAVPSVELDLQAGDLIYMPRGFVHEAMTNQEISAHITLGIYGTTWTRLILDSITKLAGQREVFRSGFFADGYKGNVDKEEILNAIRQEINQALTLENISLLSNKYRPNKNGSLSFKTIAGQHPVAVESSK
ncbi:cupin domain-containing protein [Ohtaekwangia koreensis]|uniref:Cupin superfamily protein n=1 Tax=Ohtaekwangia koreensis TaxID=688867 RepID=A0A1T5M531_9BACT|nr:cupin domain-containing protein [Ohtaekwangia koreensis]SKC83357.1 Cupin superfamily protein [Ohtaekwangia koreensis]